MHHASRPGVRFGPRRRDPGGRGLAGSLPETYPKLLELLHVRDVAKAERRGDAPVTQAQIIIEPNLARLEADYPKIHEYLTQKKTMRESRVVVHDCFVVSDGAPRRAFIHLELAILSGRDSETRRAVSNRLLDFLKGEFASSLSSFDCSLSVEVREIDRACYAKVASGPTTP